MDKKGAIDKLVIIPTCTTPILSAPTSQSVQSTSSATGNPRNKCALKPGHSLMDWIRLGNSGADLAGTGGRLISVSKDELSEHNTPNDAWMAIRGVVYNITKYIEFHPGGVEEIMRGVGTDATKLFNEVHAWVNYSHLLNKCRIGPLKNTIKIQAEAEKFLSTTNNNRFANPKLLHQADILPRFDWIQKRDSITLYFYTKKFCNPGALIRNIHDGRRIEIWIIIASYVHKFDFKLQEHFKWPPKNVRISTETGKIEITLNKREEQMNLWRDLGTYKTSKMLATSLELDTYTDFKILFKNKFNYDSFTILLKNDDIIYFCPVGYHLTIEAFENSKSIKKCYTPVPKNYVIKYTNIEADMEYICFLIKHYPNKNSFSQYLCNLENEKIKVSFPKGNLVLSALLAHRRFCFLAAGSGLTPFLSLIDHLLNRNDNRIEFLKLLYFNKTINDIWCNEVLTNMSREDSRFDFVNILSNADESWLGLKGRVSSELLFPIASKSMESVSFIAACGPQNFIICVEKILKELNFPTENLYIF